MAIYCDFARPTSSATDDTLGTSVNLTLNGKARKVFLVGATGGDQTLTAAEGSERHIVFSGDVGISPLPTIPLGSIVGSGLATTDGYNADVSWFPVDWSMGPNAVLTINDTGIGGTAADLMTVFVMYSDGEIPSFPNYYCAARGLRAVPKYYITGAFTTIAASTTETALTAITVPGGARQLVGMAASAVTDGVKVTAEEFFATVRWTATGMGGQFEPAQRWPIIGNYSASQGTPISSASADKLVYSPVSYTAQPNSTLTGNLTFQTAVSNNSRAYAHAVFT